MHDSFGEDNFEILAECEEGYIGICRHCQEFNYSFKNILLTFQEQEMDNFFEWMIGCRQNGACEMVLPHGRGYVLSSPIHNLFIVYNDEEFDAIEKLYSEVRLMREAKKILNS